MKFSQDDSFFNQKGIDFDAESDNYDNTYGKKQGAIRRRLKNKIMGQAIVGTKKGQWSARKSQELKRQYEEACEKKGLKAYKGKKTKKQKDLSKWSKQDWTTKSGKPSSETGERYLPKKAIKALTDKEYKKTSDKKRKDSKKGKQFSDQPKSIADKVAKYRAESSKPHSVTISRSSNSEKKLMAVFEDSEGKKIKTTHFGQRGASDYTKHGDKERMERYLERHGGGFETSTKENWKDPTTAGSLSRWILWNKPGLNSSFSHYKRKFGLKGSIKVSKSAEEKRQLISELVCFKCGVKDEIANYNWNENAKGCCGMGVREKQYYVKSAEERKCKSCEKPATTVVQEGSFCYDCLPINLGAENRVTTLDIWGQKAVAVLAPNEYDVEGEVYFSQSIGELTIRYDITGLENGEHGFHIHTYGDLTDGCESACSHFNPDGKNHGGLDSKVRHLGDLGNISSHNNIAKGTLKTKSLSLRGDKENCIVGRMVIIHEDRDDLGKGMNGGFPDAESLKTGNAGKRLACGVIGIRDVLSYRAEDWEEITQWEDHEPSIDPSPFDMIEWEELQPPPQNIVFLMEAFTNAGYTILVVGGAVRDLMLGLEPKDYDLATDAKPDEIKEVVDGLKGYRYVLGPQAEKSLVNLTSLVTVPNEKEAIEITTFRKELGYAGDRTKGVFIPAKTFEEDAQRRDLTINAMGMTKDGILIDPMNGKGDLQNRVIRAVGNPTQRFVEDPLRMIRAIRFSTKYGMPIENETYDAIVENADLVSELSSPRLRIEIGKVLVEPNGYQLLMETGILPVLMPEFRNMKDYHHKLDYHPEDTLYNHYIEAFKKFTTIQNRSELGAWALLFHDIAKPQTADWNEEGGYHTFYGHDKQGAQLVLENYNNQNGPFEFSKKELQAIAWTTDNHLGKFWEMKKPMKVSAMRNNENWPMLVEVVTGDTMGIRRGGDEELQRRLKEINEITNKVNEQKAKTGNRPKDFARKVIQELNVKGQEISIALNQIEELVSTGQAQSYDEALEVLKTNRTP